MLNASLDRCTEIEKANRILLEKMTSIMTSQPHLAPPPPRHMGGSSHQNLASSVELTGQRSRSLNRNMRQREKARITEENESLLKRLQEKTSCYNVYDWEIDRKKQVKMIKKICYYPPSLVKRSRLRSKRAQGAAGIDPNYEVYNYY